ncbi:autotransporter outer membrane beta-barrel domain-containing protein [Chelativorans sp. Marseille-P2723]|uniref:autotransporter family protein n=1 Tax=Chelativorans sp. Marseille-P2723 TaxID=2709133 RepID=UPI00156D8E87|nr:autotransporter outer membrane beta-barrel domain-containing protein [Chelativorans sp. Marseille-P2723]
MRDVDQFLGYFTGQNATGFVTNSGTITADKAIAIGIDHAVIVENSGDITGADAAIDLTGMGAASTLEQRSGKISGDILLSAYADQLNIYSGGIDGNIVGQGLANIDFMVEEDDIFTYGAGYAITGIDNISIHSGTALINGTSSSNTIDVFGGNLVINRLSTVVHGTIVREGGVLAVGDANHPSARLLSGGKTDVKAGGILGGYGTAIGPVENAGIIAAADALPLFEGGPAGNFTIDGNLTNSGTIMLNGGALGNTVTIESDYIGLDGLLTLNTDLSDAAVTDRLNVAGSTSGKSFVKVNHVGGQGEPADEIKIIDVGGLSEGEFRLIGDYDLSGQQAIINGAYAYMLYQGGIDTPNDGDWYLRSDYYQPGVPIYEAYANTLQDLNGLGTLQQRLGNRTWFNRFSPEAMPVMDLKSWPPAIPDEIYESAVVESSGLWLRLKGSASHFIPKESTAGFEFSQGIWKAQAGADVLLQEGDYGVLLGGASVHYGTGKADVEAIHGKGSIDTIGYGGGASLTWYGPSGFYVDGQAQVSRYESDLGSEALGTKLVENNKAIGYALSVESGMRFDLAALWSVTPQAQLSFSSVDYDDFSGPFDTLVSLADSERLTGRIGIAAERTNDWQDADGKLARAQLYGIANIYYDFRNRSHVVVADVDFVTEEQTLWGGLGMGGTYNWADNHYSVYGEATAKSSFAHFTDSYRVGGSIGFRATW